MTDRECVEVLRRLLERLRPGSCLVLGGHERDPRELLVSPGEVAPGVLVVR